MTVGHTITILRNLIVTPKTSAQKTIATSQAMTITTKIGTSGLAQTGTKRAVGLKVKLTSGTKMSTKTAKRTITVRRTATANTTTSTTCPRKCMGILTA